MTRPLVLVLFAALSVTPAVAAPSPQTAANVWLGEVDLGDYVKAWVDTDPVVQGSTSQAAFADHISGARAARGAVESRELTASQPAASPGAGPAGSYEVLTYVTRFSNGGQAVETLVMRQETDGWKASDYRLQ